MQTQQQRYRGLTNAHKRDFLDIFFCLLPALSLYRTVVACPGPPEWSFGKYSNSFPWRVTSPRPKSCLTDKHRWFVAFKWTVLLFGCSAIGERRRTSDRAGRKHHPDEYNVLSRTCGRWFHLTRGNLSGQSTFGDGVATMNRINVLWIWTRFGRNNSQWIYCCDQSRNVPSSLDNRFRFVRHGTTQLKGVLLVRLGYMWKMYGLNDFFFINIYELSTKSKVFVLQQFSFHTDLYSIDQGTRKYVNK